MKVLQLCFKMPFPIKDGGSYSEFSTAIGLLEKNVQLKVLSVNTPKEWIDVNVLPKVFVSRSKFEYAIVDTRVKVLNAFLNIFSRDSYFVTRFYSEAFEAKLKKILNSEKYDIIQLENLYMCTYLSVIRKNSNARIVLREQNVEARLWEKVWRNRKFGIEKYFLKLATKRLESYERRVIKLVDGIMAISNEDKLELISLAPNVPVTSIACGIDLNNLSIIPISKSENRQPVFYHIGSMDWLPNVEGVKWFLDSVLPGIIATYPEFKFCIAGKKTPDSFFRRACSNLKVDGEVEDSLMYQLDKDVLIVPLLSGGGVRVKILEAMSLGKAVISTSIGAEGIPYVDGENILIANTVEDFIRQIGKCLSDVEFHENIGRNAKILIKENFDRRKNAEKMISFYKEIISL